MSVKSKFFKVGGASGPIYNGNYRWKTKCAIQIKAFMRSTFI